MLSLAIEFFLGPGLDSFSLGLVKSLTHALPPWIGLRPSRSNNTLTAFNCKSMSKRASGCMLNWLGAVHVQTWVIYRHTLANK